MTEAQSEVTKTARTNEDLGKTVHVSTTAIKGLAEHD